MTAPTPRRTVGDRCRRRSSPSSPTRCGRASRPSAGRRAPALRRGAALRAARPCRRRRRDAVGASPTSPRTASFGLVLPLTCLVDRRRRAGRRRAVGLVPADLAVAGPLRGDRRRSVAGRLAGRPRHPGAGDGPGRRRRRRPRGGGPMAVAAAAGAAAYIALFVLIGVLVRRAALWSLAIVLLGEWLLGARPHRDRPAVAPCGRPSRWWPGFGSGASCWSGRASPPGADAVLRLLAITVVTLLAGLVAPATHAPGRRRGLSGR